jgi:hypothetical protein
MGDSAVNDARERVLAAAARVDDARRDPGTAPEAMDEALRLLWVAVIVWGHTPDAVRTIEGE